MTLFALRTRDDLLAVRFAISPLWETQAAVQRQPVRVRGLDKSSRLGGHDRRPWPPIRSDVSRLSGGAYSTSIGSS